MSVTSFSPESWDKSGAAYNEEAAEFASNVTAVLSGLDVAQLNSHEGGTVADIAMSTIVPALLAALTETAESISAGLAGTGEALAATAAAYRAVEEHNTDTSSTMVDGEG